MANKVVGYFESFNSIKEQVLLVDTTMTQYGPSRRDGVDIYNAGSNDATKWAILALPEYDVSPRTYDFYLITNTSSPFATDLHAYEESRNHWSSGWEEWRKFQFDPIHYDASRMYDIGSSLGVYSQYYYVLTLPYISGSSVVGSDSMPVIEESENLVNVFDGFWNRSQIRDFINEVMDTPAIPKRGYGSAVVTLNAPGENLTFESSNYEQTKIVYVHGNTSVSFGDD